jgi:hypothetical protein
MTAPVQLDDKYKSRTSLFFEKIKENGSSWSFVRRRVYILRNHQNTMVIVAIQQINGDNLLSRSYNYAHLGHVKQKRTLTRFY